MKAVTLIQELLIDSALKCPQKYALFIGKDRFTYEYLINNAIYFARKLKQNGLKRGDRVVVCAKNSIYTVVAFWGTLIADGIISIISSDMSEEKIKYILRDSGANAFITDRPSDLLIEQCQLYQTLSQIYVNPPHNSHQKGKVHLFNTTNEQQDLGSNFDFSNNELDLASIIYTSGSTGEPKGVMMTHRNMLTATFSINQYLGHKEDDVILSALQMSFDYGLYQMIMAFSVGARLVLEVDAFMPVHILRKIETERATVLPCVPTLVSLLTEHGNRFKYDYSSLRAVTNTGAQLTQKNINALQNNFPNAKIFSMYGLTECKRCSYLPPAEIDRKPDSVGIAIPNTELWIVDEIGQKVGPGVLGQLVVRGATVMKGYWNKADATNEKLKEGPVPGEKVLYTGDYGVLDEEGYLYFKGRMDETIKYKGIKVSPTEIEACLSSLTEIKDVAVFGVLKEDNDVVLSVCVSSYKNFSEEKIKRKILSVLPKSLSSFELLVMTDLPKNANGKIDKNVLKTKVYENIRLDLKKQTHNSI